MVGKRCHEEYMKFRRIFRFLDFKRKGQSLVELTMVLSLLLTLMVGMVEFGNLLNQYINLVDGAREGARFASNDDPFSTVEVKNPTSGLMETKSNYPYFFSKIYQVVEGVYTKDPITGVETQETKGAISPIVLSKENGDDIVVSFFTVTGDSSRSTGSCTSPGAIQDPADSSLFRYTPDTPPSGAPASARSRYSNKDTAFTDAQVKSLLDGCAPNAGVLLVEVFYNYHQILKLGSFLKDADGNGILDPIPVHTYSIMPLSSAEPTPTTPP
jgi:hypothetical protein